MANGPQKSGRQLLEEMLRSCSQSSKGATIRMRASLALAVLLGEIDPPKATVMGQIINGPSTE